MCDIYDALRSQRPYKPSFNHERAAAIIIDGDGRTLPEHFDPEVREIFRIHNKKFEEIFETLQDEDEDLMPGGVEL